MNTNTDATLALAIVVKHMLKAVGIPDDLTRARLLDSVRAELAEKLGAERLCAAFRTIAPLWD
jgi:hypothetical protein